MAATQSPARLPFHAPLIDTDRAAPEIDTKAARLGTGYGNMTFNINRVTGEVTPTNPDRLASSMAYQQQMADLQRRITAALAAGNSIDEGLARAINLELPQGTPAPAAPGREPVLPPPRTPGANDDPWQHGGDRRWK